MASLLNRSRRRSHSQFAVIDIGASKAACFIARMEHEAGLAPQVEIAGVGYHGAPVHSRERPYAERIELAVRKAVDSAERMAGARVNEVSVAVPGRLLNTRRVGVDIEIAGGVVTREDVEECLAEGASVAAAPGCAALHELAAGYKIDGEEIHDDPVGLNASMLSTELLGVCARQSALDNLSSLVERCGLSVCDFVAAPFVAGEGALIDDEKDLGVVLIDIGAGSTAYAVYDHGVLFDCGGVGVGGAHITRDIAQIFGTPVAHAERIKTLYGAALIGPGDEHRFIDFPEIGVVGETSRASRADICEVILSRMEEIFELVAERLPDDRLRRSGLRRAVITGGGSLLVGAREIAEKTLAMKTRIGRPIAISGAPETATGPGFAVCAGMVQARVNAEAGANSTLGAARQSLHAFREAFVLDGVKAWLRERF